MTEFVYAVCVESKNAGEPMDIVSIYKNRCDALIFSAKQEEKDGQEYIIVAHELL